MTTFVETDELDRAILRLLHTDARMPSSRIAKYLDVTDRTVRNRIDKILDGGLVRIGLLVDPEAAGFPIIGMLHIDVEGGAAEQVAQTLSDDDRVNFVALSISDWDVSIQMYARSHVEMLDWVNNHVACLDGVRHVRSAIHPRIYKRPADWFPPSWAEAPAEALVGHDGKGGERRQRG